MTIWIKFHTTIEDEKYLVRSITLPIEYVTFFQFNLVEYRESLPKKIGITYLPEESNFVKYFAISDIKNIISEIWRKHLDQFIFLFLTEKGMRIVFDVLLDLFWSVERNLCFSGKIWEPLDTILNCQHILTVAWYNWREISNNEWVKGNSNHHPNKR